MAQRQYRFAPVSLLISFLLAVGLWIYVSLNSDYSTFIDLPLYITLPENRAIETTIPQSIKALVQGKGWQLLNMQFSFPPRCAVVIAEKMLEGNQTSFTINRKMLLQSLQLQPNVTPLNVIPDSIALQIGTISQKKVPVYPVLRVSLREGFIISGTPNIEPDSVVIRGNKKILNTIEYWKTEPIVMQDMYKPVNTTVRLSDSLNNIIQLTRSSASVYLDVQQIAEMTLDNMRVELLSAPTDNRIIFMPPRVSVTVRGGINQISTLNPNDVKVFIDYSDILHNTTGLITPRVSLPTDINVLHLSPPRVQYVYRIPTTQ